MAIKFTFHCGDCSSLVQWQGFSRESACDACGCGILRIEYPEMTWGNVIRMFEQDSRPIKHGLWRYFDYLPLLCRRNIVTSGEGNVPVERWEFLEQFASAHRDIKCKVFAHRHDSHPSTGSFKDLAASVVSSALKEHGVKEYVVASTGNIGVAYSRYLAAADITLYVFIPINSARFKEAEIACFGQNVFRVKGDYTAAKKAAADFARQHGLVLGGGSFDPFRVEAKKTMAFEWYRQMSSFPDVYIQALSGGTGPLGVFKGCQELFSANLINKMPRMLLVQSNKCAPMARAWQKAKMQGFPKGWNFHHEKIDNPDTEIPTLATSDPTSYPRLAPIVHTSEGAIFDFPENLATVVASVVAFEVGVRLGPAAAIAVGGFYEALKRRLIRNGDIVVIAAGEGIRRDPDFMLRMTDRAKIVEKISDCIGVKRTSRREKATKPILEYINEVQSAF